MRIRKNLLASALIVVFGGLIAEVPAAAWQGSRIASPSAVTRSFFEYHLRRGCGFTVRDIKDRRDWFTPELYRLLLHEKERERAFARQYPDRVPYYDGDPFTSSQEYPTWFVIGVLTRKPTDAEVEIAFFFGHGKHAERRPALVRLHLGQGRWRIDDIIDSRSSSLKQELSRTNYEG